MPNWVIEVLIIYLIIAISIAQGYAAEDCDYLVIRAYECQFDWQQGEDCKPGPASDLEKDMLIEVREYKRHSQPDHQQQAAVTFARAWKSKCANRQ